MSKEYRLQTELTLPDNTSPGYEDYAAFAARLKCHQYGVDDHAPDRLCRRMMTEGCSQWDAGANAYAGS